MDDDYRITRMRNQATNGRWLVLALAAIWVAFAFINDRYAGLGFAAFTVIALGFAWVADNTDAPGWSRFFAIAIPVVSFIALVFVTLVQ